MSEMIERVAIAIMDHPEAWATAPEQAKAVLRRMARAAIEAMREPNTDMIEAGYDAEREPPGGALMAYRAMMEEALR